MKSDGRDNTPNLAQLDTKKTSKARWIYKYHVPIQKSNNGVQYRKATREYTNCCMLHRYIIFNCLKRNRPSEHPPVRGENVKTFRWDHRLQRQNLFMAFKRVPLCMVVTLGQLYNVGEKPTVILYTYINRHAGTPHQNKT